MIVVSDSTILIGLAMIKKVHFLQDIFGKIYIPEAVYHEVVEKSSHKRGVAAVKNASWIEVRPITDSIYVHLLMASLEQGEAETLGLAKELQADLILLDEEKARKSAVLAGFKVMGVLGVLIAAKQLGLIPNLRAEIDVLHRKKFRLSERVITAALQKAGESL